MSDTTATKAAADAISPWFGIAIQGGASLIGAALGATGGWLTAVRKLKGERAFERRLEWHDAMLAALSEQHDALMDGLLNLKQKKGTQGDVVTKSATAANKVRALRRSAYLYAGANALRLLEDALASGAKILEAEKGAPTLTDEKFSEVLTGFAVALGAAALEVAKEGRAHLGGEKLPDVVYEQAKIFKKSK